MQMTKERTDVAVAFEPVPGKPPQFAARILESIQSYYAMEELDQ